MKLFIFLSPTWKIADYLKKKFDRTKVINTLNALYLSVSLVSVICIIIYQEYFLNNMTMNLNDSLSFIVVLIWSYFLLSRCNEIFWAFLQDAFDRIDKNKNQFSNLTFADRIKLSLKSYIELILNFSLLYALLPANNEIWNTNNVPTSIFDTIYFSGVTITTLGYGDISPNHWYPKLLTVYEVFCGFILLIVCFTIYTGNINQIESNQ